MGKLPKPDLIVMADTGDEATETWEYTIRYVLPLLDSLGLTLEIAPASVFAKVGLYGRKNEILMPVYTQTGKFPTYCSDEWKKQVCRRYLRWKGVEQCVTWLGMSADEIDRIKPSDVQWQEYQWPLANYPLTMGYGIQMNRVECRQLILNYGWPDPPKSCCWDCPHRRNPQWQRLKQFYPQDFAKAVVRDKELREHDPLHAVYLHESRKPLDEVDFTQPDSPTLFGEENGGCASGFCFM